MFENLRGWIRMVFLPKAKEDFKIEVTRKKTENKMSALQKQEEELRRREEELLLKEVEKNTDKLINTLNNLDTITVSYCEKADAFSVYHYDDRFEIQVNDGCEVSFDDNATEFAIVLDDYTDDRGINFKNFINNASNNTSSKSLMNNNVSYSPR